MRIRAILAPVGPIPVSRSKWWAGVASGQFPKPLKISSRVTGWRVEDIRALIQNLENTTEQFAQREDEDQVETHQTYGE